MLVVAAAVAGLSASCTFGIWVCDTRRPAKTNVRINREEEEPDQVTDTRQKHRLSTGVTKLTKRRVLGMRNSQEG